MIWRVRLLTHPPLFSSEIDEDEPGEYKNNRKGNNPTEGAMPADAVDVEEKVGEPVVAGDEMAHVDEGYVEIGEEDAALYAAYCDLTYRACGEEIEGIEAGGEEVQTYTGPIGPIGRRGGISQQEIVYGTNDENGDKSAKLPLHQWNGYRFATYEAYQLIGHQSEAIEIAQIGEVEEEAGAVDP